MRMAPAAIGAECDLRARERPGYGDKGADGQEISHRCVGPQGHAGVAAA